MFSLLTTKQGLLILLCGVTQTVSAQSITTDSLYNLPFDDMDRVFKTLPKTEQEQLAQAYLQKAKQENENYKKANGYYLHSFLSSFTGPSIQYADSIIQVSQAIKQYPYPGLGYLQRGIEFYYVNKTQESLDNYIKSNTYFSQAGDKFNLLRVQHYIALLKNKIDRPQEALPIFKKNMSFFEKEEYQKKYKNQYLKSLFALADSYNRNRHSYDIAERIIVEGIQKSLTANDQMYPYFLFIYGATKILKKQPELAIDSIIKGNKLINDKRNIASNYIDIGLLYGKTNNKKLAIKYLLKVDSMYQKSPETINYAHEANEFLYKNYGKYFEIEQKLEIVNKLLALDSILKKQRAILHNEIIKKYETPQLLLEKDTLIVQLENKRIKNRISFFILTLLSLAFLIFLTITFQKNRHYKKRFQILLKNDPSKIISKKSSLQTSLREIPQDLIENILQKLEVFEQKQRFIKKKYTLESLARELKTNSSYLSKVINATQNSNFSTYINTLRIGYAVERLKKDTLFRTYTIEGIAQACGFNTSQAFSTAFYKKTGIYPAYFIKQLKKIK